MDHRCNWTRDTAVHLYKKVGSYSKNIDIVVHEHWCEEEPDVAWCENYAQVHVELEKNYSVVVATKDIDVLEPWGQA